MCVRAHACVGVALGVALGVAMWVKEEVVCVGDHYATMVWYHLYLLPV